MFGVPFRTFLYLTKEEKFIVGSAKFSRFTNSMDITEARFLKMAIGKKINLGVLEIRAMNDKQIVRFIQSMLEIFNVETFDIECAPLAVLDAFGLDMNFGAKEIIFREIGKSRYYVSRNF